VVDVRVQGAEKFAALAAYLRGPATKEVRRQLSKRLRTAVKPAVQDVKAKVRALPVRSVGGGGTAQRREHRAGRGKSHGLRSTIAAGVRVEVRYGDQADLKIVVRPNLPASQRRLPRHLNKRSGWRHPVYGHRDRWVRQVGGEYFETTIRARQMGIAADLVDALDEAAKTIARAAIRGG
jgi:hypothetical protein